MLNRLTAALALLAGLGLHPVVAAQKKPKPKTATKPVTTKRAAKKKVSARSARAKTQSIPTPERYKEIQEALAAKGYLPADQATGQWNDASVDALKRFQADQKIDSNGRINSMSLIALGLGPRHETSPSLAQQQP
jgi:peptidoglycan hydrolase-like protein with peptidoglycan-binding domain